MCRQSENAPFISSPAVLTLASNQTRQNRQR